MALLFLIFILIRREQICKPFLHDKPLPICYNPLMRKKIHVMFICLIASSIVFMNSACTAPDTAPVTQTGFYFDTVITVTLYSSTEGTLLDSCMSLADDYEKLLSRTMEGSDIFRINHAAGAPTEVSPETAELLSTALRFAKLTNGKVDPTIGIVSELWDFHDSAAQRPPKDADIKAALSHVNYENVFVSGNTVTLLDPQARLDLGFIAKGYIADKMKEYLLSEGVTSALINLGGNVLTIGAKPDGSAFTIGIQKPFADAGTPADTVSVRDTSVVSSGVYERFFEYEGRLYHHILDTSTGYPVENDLLAVSILSASSTDGDALSTACMALGYDAARNLIDSLEGVDAIFITSDGEIHK